MSRKLELGYTCGCGRFHDFPHYVFAHTKDLIDHTCGCGRVNTIYETRVTRVEWKPETKKEVQ